jgi:hypothetical protein
MNRMHIEFVIQTQIETLYPYEAKMMKPVANRVFKILFYHFYIYLVCPLLPGRTCATLLFSNFVEEKT